MKKLFCNLSALILLVTCVPTQAQQPRVATSSKDMVVSVSRPATEIGVQILADGGTAVDAAVAVAIALQVTWPEAGNIGGGGFMMVHEAAGRRPVFLDYREVAPGTASATMYGRDETTHHCRAVGVPGTLRGLQMAHQKYGRLPWATLIKPSVRLAAEGFQVDAGLVDSLKYGLKSTPADFTEFHRIYGPPDGQAWKVGDVLVQPELAKTLSILASQGSDAFYLGSVGDQLVAEMERGHGLISKADLASYQAKEREPIHIPFRGYDIYAPSPPSSGGICLAEMFQIWERSPVRDLDRWSADSVHYRAETMRRVFLDRARHLGDPDFVNVPLFLTTPEHAAELATSIPLDKATLSRDLAPDLLSPPESKSTTHFSIVDSSGMSVSNTYTLEESFGSRVVVRGAGFLLNNEMGDFNWFPGETTEKRRIGTPANEIRPGKRMLSSMTPVIVLKEGNMKLVTGSPGGRTIINTVFCVLMNVLAFDTSLQEAVASPRFHHQWMPDQITCEETMKIQHPELLQDLQQRGHKLNFSDHQGDAHSIMRVSESGDLLGVADTRLSGAATGR